MRIQLLHLCCCLTVLAACGTDAVTVDDAQADVLTDTGNDPGPVDVQVQRDLGDPNDTGVDPTFWVPAEMADLYGMWANDDGTTVRVFEFLDQESNLTYTDMLGVSPVYHLYVYPSGQSPVLQERGRVTMALGGVLSLTKHWSVDGAVSPGAPPTQVTLVPAPPKHFALATVSGTPRLFKKTFKFP